MVASLGFMSMVECSFGGCFHRKEKYWTCHLHRRLLMLVCYLYSFLFRLRHLHCVGAAFHDTISFPGESLVAVERLCCIELKRLPELVKLSSSIGLIVLRCGQIGGGWIYALAKLHLVAMMCYFKMGSCEF